MSCWVVWFRICPVPTQTPCEVSGGCLGAGQVPGKLHDLPDGPTDFSMARVGECGRETVSGDTRRHFYPPADPQPGSRIIGTTGLH